MVAVKVRKYGPFESLISLTSNELKCDNINYTNMKSEFISQRIVSKNMILKS